MTQRIIQQRQDGIVTVSLNRPEKHNAVDWPMLNALANTARKLQKDRTIRAIILRAEGPSFCSGLDFPSFTKTPDKILRSFIKIGLRPTNLFQEACMAWRAIPVPVIACLQGHCYGAGMQLALAADFRIASPQCNLSIMEVQWGLIPDMSGSITLRELIGIDRAKLLTMTGRQFSASEALDWGLVTEVDPAPLAVAQNLANELKTKSPDALAGAKKLFHQSWQSTPQQALRNERHIQTQVLFGKNFSRTLRANAKKEKPTYKKRSWWI